MLANKLEGAAAAASPVYVEDVFSTYLYDGNTSTQTITNNIDLSTKGGLVWIKSRSGTRGHRFTDTARGVTKALDSTSTAGQATESTGLTAFNTNGFTLGADANYNGTGDIYTSWTFRKQAKFFDVVTYTGNATNRTISHNLGSVPGCIIIKSSSNTKPWAVYHSGIGNGKYLVLDTTAGEATSATYWNNTSPTSTNFSLGTESNVNANGDSFVAYLFASDAGGFGTSGSDNVATCGSFIADAGGATTLSLGYEPQWLLLKCSQAAQDWYIFDNMRGMAIGQAMSYLRPNSTGAETSATFTSTLSATGVTLTGLSADTKYVYIAIRRPMKTPTDATKVFTPTIYTGTNVDNRLVDTTIAPDMVMIRQRNDTVVPGMYVGARLTGQENMATGSDAIASTDADSFDQQIVSTTEYGNAFSSMTGVWVGNDATRKFNANTTSNNHVIHAFKRAPGFFDVVCYTGTGSNRTITHNLGVTPEFILVKRRNTSATNWAGYLLDNTSSYVLNSSGTKTTSSAFWQNTNPTSSVFSIGNANEVNASSGTYIALLFASLSGVSKIGTYTGNGSTQTINCGFTNGSRYVLIRRTDNNGSWWVIDSARGIGSGNDPSNALNLTNAETTTVDFVSSDSSGFILNNTDVNISGASYFYLAIA